MDIQIARVNTAGAYVCVNGYYLFAIGIQPYKGRIPIVRLGGHRKAHETGWQCAAREVYEETSLRIKPLLPQTTYLADWDQLESDLQEIRWQPKSEQESAPILVLTYLGENMTSLSLMYLAHAEGVPKPSSEVKGLILLEKDEIHHLRRDSMTLEEYLRNGGRAILKEEFEARLLLEPFAQLRLLSKILSVQSDIKVA